MCVCVTVCLHALARAAAQARRFFAPALVWAVPGGLPGLGPAMLSSSIGGSRDRSRVLQLSLVRHDVVFEVDLPPAPPAYHLPTHGRVPQSVRPRHSRLGALPHPSTGRRERRKSGTRDSEMKGQGRWRREHRTRAKFSEEVGASASARSTNNANMAVQATAIGLFSRSPPT